MIFRQVLSAKPTCYVTVMSHLEVHPFLKLVEADGLVAVEIHAHLVLGWTAALLYDECI